MLNELLQKSLKEIESGISYDEKSNAYTCLVCGKKYDSGEIFPVKGKFYSALKAVQIHIEEEHGHMLRMLLSYDKKYTGITDNQKELLEMIFSGLSDKEIAEKAGVTAATVRHQRFIFREKAKQAKLYLSIFEIVERAASEKRTKNIEDELMDIHSNAKMVDDRYSITKAEEDKIINSAFESLDPLKLKMFSPKEKKKIVILRKITSQFEYGRRYTEKEVNSILMPVYEDYATIRRYLIEYGFMERTNDCKEYWLK
jgi:Uncharacterized protein conserved in bacteria